LEHAARVVAAYEVVSSDGSLRYLHDAGATTLSNFGLVIYKLFWRLGPDARPYLIEVTNRARDCCPPEGALVYTARFLDRVLGLLRAAVAEDAAPAAEVGPPDQSQIVSAHLTRLTTGRVSASRWRRSEPALRRRLLEYLDVVLAGGPGVPWLRLVELYSSMHVLIQKASWPLTPPPSPSVPPRRLVLLPRVGRTP
jgi:hypothetical protein